MSCLRIVKDVFSTKLCRTFHIHLWSSLYQNVQLPRFLSDTFLTSKSSCHFDHFLIYRPSQVSAVNYGPADSPLAVREKYVSPVVTYESSEEMKHKKKKSHHTERKQGSHRKGKLNKPDKTAHFRNKKKHNKNKLKYLAMASGFQGSFSVPASRPAADENDGIVVLYDKLEEEKKTQASIRRQLDSAVCLADQFDIKLEDIPLPPENLLLQSRNIPVESIPLPSSPMSCGRTWFKNSNKSEESIHEVKYMSELLKKFRKWENVYSKRRITDSAASSSEDSSHQINSFKILSYNVLAQQLLEQHRYLYRKHNQRVLSWDYRSSVLLKEIKEADADILCFQEVQASHINSFYKQLEHLGYKGLFKQRTNGKVDGCALYYKTDKFKLKESSTVEYYQNYVPDMHLLDRDNIAIIARLELQEHRHDGSGNQIVVATTHLLYNPRRHDIKLAQTQVLLAELDRVSYIGYEQTTGKPKYLPIILTGDFNLEPNSAVYRFLVGGSLRYSDLTYRLLNAPSHNEYRQETLLPPSVQISTSCQHLGLMRHRMKQPTNVTVRPEGEINLLKLYNSDVYKSVPQYLSMTSENPPVTEDNFNHIPHLKKFGNGSLHHNLNLLSVYKHNKSENKKDRNRKMETEATTHQNDWVTVDYIFYSGTWNENAQHVEEGRLKLLSRYTLPTCAQCQTLKNLPNLVCGSDHLSLMAQFLLMPDDPKEL